MNIINITIHVCVINKYITYCNGTIAYATHPAVINPIKSILHCLN